MKWPALCAGVLVIAAGPATRSVHIVRNSSALEFEYQWDAEATAIAPLNRKLHAKAEALYRQALKDARDDRAGALHDKRPFHRHSVGINWEAVGQTPRLLSIAAAIFTDTGGAHPNHNVDAELWDRRTRKRIAIETLFLRPGDFAALTRAAYCKALDKERLARRNGESFGGMFDDCPKYADLAVYPRDREPDGRFETIDFSAAPYTAGPYVEGEYGIPLPVTARLIAAMKPEYGASFEVQRQ
jgi:hypothetical protein